MQSRALICREKRYSLAPLAGTVTKPSGAAAVSERHAALLEQAANHLDAACECVQAESWELAGSSLRTAAELIGCITGETATPDILDEIFSRFCIGK